MQRRISHKKEALFRFVPFVLFCGYLCFYLRLIHSACATKAFDSDQSRLDSRVAPDGTRLPNSSFGFR